LLLLLPPPLLMLLMLLPLLLLQPMEQQVVQQLMQPDRPTRITKPQQLHSLACISAPLTWTASDGVSRLKSPAKNSSIGIHAAASKMS
jgi:hypothetical protein